MLLARQGEMLLDSAPDALIPLKATARVRERGVISVAAVIPMPTEFSFARSPNPSNRISSGASGSAATSRGATAYFSRRTSSEPM
jgi:hypothetical protein